LSSWCKWRIDFGKLQRNLKFQRKCSNAEKYKKKILRRVPLFFSRKKGILEYLFLNINLSSLLLSLPAFELMTWLVAVEHIPTGHK
jgi:hypothetical protein